MGEIKEYPKAKLVLGILASHEEMLDSLYTQCIAHFGPIDCTSRSIPFVFSSYYNPEMGTPISRLFISIKPLVDPSSLSEIKTKTNNLEKQFMIDGKRKINIDPGIMFQSRFILASTKDSAQRIPLSSGMYGEITLLFEKKTFRPVEWTYPDYRSPEYIRILNSIRELYKEQLNRE